MASTKNLVATEINPAGMYPPMLSTEFASARRTSATPAAARQTR
ncbi:hypothetical protein [Cryobacterium sp. PH31-O1]|nr:hypothetical protein [Cryobacterium sp. PH31-O1]MDJ0336669.1 hypothetical protein [Cryobacterium sp. PH31-O1]